MKCLFLQTFHFLKCPMSFSASGYTIIFIGKFYQCWLDIEKSLGYEHGSMFKY